MKKLTFLLLGVVMMTFTSCIDIVEEMFLKKDGSGEYKLTMDMSAMMKEGAMKGMMEGMFNELGVDEPKENPAGDNIVDPKRKKEETQPDKPKRPMEMDSIMYLKDLPDSSKQRLDRPEFYDKVKIHIKASEKKEMMKMTYILDFDNMADIDYFYQNLDKFTKESEPKEAQENPLGGMGGMGGMGGGMPGMLPKGMNLFKLAGKKLTRNKDTSTEKMDMESQDMALMKMMFAGAKYTTIYHFPSKVKKTTIDGAKVEKRTVTVESSVMDMMEGKAAMDGYIKFK